MCSVPSWLDAVHSWTCLDQLTKQNAWITGHGKDKGGGRDKVCGTDKGSGSNIVGEM